MSSSRKMDAFCCTCRGASHLADDKPCQDCSLTVSERNLTIAVVCDGHGGGRYFRSDAGARMAAEVAVQAVRAFVRDVDEYVFFGRPFTSVGPGRPEKGGKVDEVFRQLFSSIIYKWNDRIESHAGAVPLSQWEMEHVERKYLDDFSAGRNLEKTYGCTLMVFVRTRRYWFAFHIGDGKCISFGKDGSWSEPIPWDDRCFLNRTTSMCDSDAVDNFRYCCQGDGQFPSAVFLGSDGIDDSFGETENMIDFYTGILGEIHSSREGAVRELRDELPELSSRGSKDDMSVSCAYEEDDLEEMLQNLLQWQIERVESEERRAQSSKETSARNHLRLLSDLCDDVLKTILDWDGNDNTALASDVYDMLKAKTIDIQYAISDKEKAEELLGTLAQKKERLEKKRDKLIQNKKSIWAAILRPLLAE